MKKVISRIVGGIGNQLFCYAAARRLALVNDAELVIDHISGFKYDYEYKREYQLDHFTIPCRKATRLERLEPFSRVRRYIKRARNLSKPFVERSYLKQEIIDYDPRLLQVQVHNTIYLEGNWQSEKYFKDVEKIIRSDLEIIPPEDEVNNAMASRIASVPAVAVHVRFFDIPGSLGINNVRGEYYNRAIKRMESLAPGAHYFIFSDLPEKASECIPLADEKVTYVTHNRGDLNAYADFWLMAMCQHFIIANSTFSWWAAWLAKNPGKIVIAPDFEVRSGSAWWGFEGLLPREWLKI